MNTLHGEAECSSTSMDDCLRSAEEWRVAFEAISDLVAILDKDYRLVRVNKAYARAVGAAPETIIGRKCYEVFHHTNRRREKCLQERAFSSGETVTEEFFEPSLNAYVEMTVSPIRDGNGDIIRTVHIIKNISERKKAEEILRRDKTTLEKMVYERTAELLSAQKELEDARRLSDIGVLAATIAHEIRNPLAAIRTAAYNISRKISNPSIASHLANIDKKVLESDQIIKNLLSYSRIRLPSYERFSLQYLLDDCVHTAGEKYFRAQVKVIKDIRFPSQSIIEADPVHLRVLFSNILDNAYQSMENREGTLRIDASLERDMYRITFTDTGSGIPPDILPRVVEPFFTKKSKGIGLGLTICAQIVNLHKGSINIESGKEKGAVVTVRLPAARIFPSSDKGEKGT